MIRIFFYSLLGTILISTIELDHTKLVGKWHFSYEASDGTVKGVFNIKEENGKLSGNIVATEYGELRQFAKVEIKKEDILYLQVYEGSGKIVLLLKIDNNKFEGTISSNNRKTQITGKTVE